MAKILLIDDNSDFREMVRQMLEPEGYEIQEATDGQNGMELFRQSPADLVLTDILMPDKDGISTMCDLKKEFRDVKIIVVSGGGDYGNAEDYLSAAKTLGALRILTKPFKRAELIAMVKEVLGE